jgi:hypothetical protein
MITRSGKELGQVTNDLQEKAVEATKQQNKRGKEEKTKKPKGNKSS